jgi:hypothetical protein
MLAPLTLLAAMAFAGPQAAPPARPAADTFKPDPAWKPLGKDIWFDREGRRLVLRARVAIRDGALEHLLCSKGSKDHESTLTTQAPPRMIHAGLLLVGSEKGHPVRFEPKFEPPTGSAIAINLEWVDAKGKTQTADARTWIKDLKTGAALKTDWVFAGSEEFDDPRTKERVYAADDGDLITVANFPSSILDLPFRSSADDGDRTFVSNTDVMPERDTPVTIYLKPRPKPPAPPLGAIPK